MSFSVSYVYEILDRYTAPLRKINDKTERFNRVIETAQRKASSFGRTLNRVGDGMSSVGQTMVTRITAVGVAVAGLALKAAADMEQLEMSFGVMLRSMEKGADVMNRLKTFAAKTPFEIKGIAKSAKTLLAFRVSNEDLIDRLTMLCDISAGVNAPLSDIAAIFGKVKAKGKLMAEELNQMSERGIPVVSMLAEEIQKKFGGTIEQATARVFKLGEKGQIKFKDLLRVMQKMTSQGGLFNRMMEVQSNTLGGLFSTLKDSLFFALEEVGKIIVRLFGLKDVMRKIIAAIDEAVRKFKQWGKANPELGKMVLAIAGIVMALGPLLLMGAPLVKMFGFLFAGAGAVSLIFVKIAAVVALLAIMFKRWHDTNSPMIPVLKRMWESLTLIFHKAILPLLDGLSRLIVWLVGTKDEAGALAAVFDVIGLVLGTVLSLLDAFFALVMGDEAAAGTIFDDLLISLDEFAKGSGMVAQIYNGMVTTIGQWVDKIAGFFTMIKQEITDVIDKVQTVVPLLAKAGVFGGFVQQLAGDTGEKTSDATAKNKQNQQVDISGIIAVQGQNGATIEKAAIQLDQGDNLATVR
jgi:tape measure domain-containing protein